MQLPFELKMPLVGAAIGAFALAMIGFTWGGWMTTNTANRLAEKQAEIAIVAALAPICADDFQKQTGAVEKLATLKATTSYQQAQFIVEGGWATMAGAEKPSFGTAQGCAELLRALPE